jgi:hypothetical protein
MRAFIIRPFGVKQGIDFDGVAKDLIDPALTKLGVTGRDTIEILKQGNIRVDMFQRLLTADLVVADLSIHNANVFYELGIRHALRAKRTFLLRWNQDAYPFDLQTDRYFTYDKDRPAAKLDELTEALRRTIASEDQDSPVFRSLPDLAEQPISRFLAVPRGFRDEVELAATGKQLGDLGLLAAEAAGFEWESEGLRLVGRAQFRLRAHDGARAAWEAIRAIDADDLEANTLLGTIYQRLGDLTQSDLAVRRVLDRRAMDPGTRAEAHALLGRNAKSRWTADWNAAATPEMRREKALRSPFLRESYECYARGFATDLNHFYSGLNALAVLTILIELANALPEVWSEPFEDDAAAKSDLAEQQAKRDKLAAATELSIAATQARLTHEKKTDIWAEISAADVICLTSKRPARASAAYREALAGAKDFEVASARDQLRVYESLGILTDNVRASLEVLGSAPEAGAAPAGAAAPGKVRRVLAFTGHMVDAPGRKTPRFPPDKEDAARQAIEAAIVAECKRPGGVALGIAGGASGGDILFHELCAKHGISTQLLLALPINQFIEASVAPAGGDWVTRFDRLTQALPTRVLAASKALPGWLAEKAGYNIWQRNNLWTLHNAIAEGGENVTLIALWNGEEGDGPGGTGDLVARAKEWHARVVILRTNEIFGLG